MNEAMKSSCEKLMTAVNALAVQTGESPESIVDWLADNGGLTNFILLYFSGQPTAKDSLTVQAMETDRKVVRYSFEEGSLDIKEDEFGNYVEISGYEALRAENERLKEENKSMSQTLQYVERWANHHAVKPRMTAVEALSCIQHYPCILDITRGYDDGKIPATPNPFAERDALQAQVNLFNEEKIKAGINWHKEYK